MLKSWGACAAAVRSWTTTDHALVSHADVDVVVVFVVVVATLSDRAVRVSSNSTRPHVATTRIRIVHPIAVPSSSAREFRSKPSVKPFVHVTLNTRLFIIFVRRVVLIPVHEVLLWRRLFVRDSAENDVANRSTRIVAQESRGLRR